MFIRYVSDLHLELSAVDLPQLPNDDQTILILAGDIGNFSSHETTTIKHLTKWSLQFKQILYVLGNHDVYNVRVDSGSNIQNLINQSGLSNVYVLDKKTHIVDNVCFIGATLWTDYNNADQKSMRFAEYAMADYRYIFKDDRDLISAQDILKIHRLHRFFIFEEAKKAHINGLKPVVITHHLPSYQSVHPFYANSDLNSAFASDMDNEIVHSDIAIWFHGHTHYCFDYIIGNTAIKCNPRGYVVGKRIENPVFNSSSIINV